MAKRQQNTSPLVRVEHISNFCGVTVRRIQQLTQEGVIKSVEANDGKSGRMYDFLPTISCLLQYYRERADRKTEPNAAMEEEKLKQITARREIDELKLATIKGNLHHTEDIEKVFGALFTRLRVGLLALPLSVAPLLLEQTDINKIAETISDRLNQCLLELSSFDFNMFAESSGDYIDSMLEEEEDDAEIAEDEQPD